MPHFRNFHGTSFDFSMQVENDSFEFKTASDVPGTGAYDPNGDAQDLIIELMDHQTRDADEDPSLPDTITWTNVDDGLDWQPSQFADDFLIA